MAGFSEKRTLQTKFYDFDINYRFQVNNLKIKLPFLIHLIEITKLAGPVLLTIHDGRVRGCLFH